MARSIPLLALLLAPPAAAFEQAAWLKGAPAPAVPGPVAGIPALDQNGIPLWQGPMLDLVELKQPRLQTSGSSFLQYGSERRGLRTVSFDAPPPADAVQAAPRLVRDGVPTVAAELLRAAGAIHKGDALPAGTIIEDAEGNVRRRVCEGSECRWEELDGRASVFLKGRPQPKLEPTEPRASNFFRTMTASRTKIQVDPVHAMVAQGHVVPVGTKKTINGVVAELKEDADGLHYWEATRNGQTAVLYASPLVFDLNGDGVRMSRRGRRLDADGDHKRDSVNDISKSDGILVLDVNKNGIWGEGAQELLGTGTDLDADGRPDGYADGFAALKALAKLAEARRLLPEGSAARGELGWAALAALEAGFGLRMKVGGANEPAVPLERAGVVSISLPTAACERVEDFDGQGNETLRCAGAFFRRADGKVGVYEDVWFEL